MRPMKRVACLLVLCAGLAGCATAHDDATRASLDAIAAVNQTQAAGFANPPNRKPVWPCSKKDPTPSLRPPASLPQPGHMPPGTYMAQIQRAGRLVVGVDQNTTGFGYRDPAGNLGGFDIDLLREVARAIFGDPNAITFRSVTSDERVPAVANGDVDIVGSLLSITCVRWQQVDFSSEYYETSQGVLVRSDSPIRSVADLNNRRVCATRNSTSIQHIHDLAKHAQITAVPFRTDCLVLLQQGAVDAVSADDTILAGFEKQDPANTRPLPDKLETERYGMAISTKHPEFVRFVNGVLEGLRTSGRLRELEAQDIEGTLGISSPPTPKPRYRA
jgi:polar amino acid transport system substrate-binding protein